MFKGLAVGGPLDGKSIAWSDERYKVAEMEKVPPYPYSSMEKMLSDAIRMDVFEYVHYRTPGGDVWIPRAVERGERYEHRLWKHPLEYIFSKLIRGYKPDGY